MRNAISDFVRLFDQQVLVEVQKPGFNDSCNGVWVNFRKSVVPAHVVGDTPGMKTKAGDVLVTVAQAFGQARSAVEIVRIDCCSHLETGCFVIDVLARVIVNRDQRYGAVAIQTRIELIEQVHLIAFICQGFLHPTGNVQVDICFGQSDIAVAVAADGA